jgi:oligopeptidase A
MDLHFYEDGVPTFPFENIAHALPAFSIIGQMDIVGIVNTAIDGCKDDIEKILATNTEFTWDNLMVPLDELGDYMHRLYSPVNHMNSCLDDELIREANTEVRSMLTEYGSWCGQHEGLYLAIKSLGDTDLTPEQRRAYDAEMLGFRLSGCDLPEDEQEHLTQVNMCLSKLANQFSNNVVDATAAYSKVVKSADELDGLPETALKAAKYAADQAGEEGYLFTLDVPSVFPVLEHCTNRELREELTHAMVTRASETGPNGGEFDNTSIIEDILQLKHEKAQILGYANYAELSLVRKSAPSPMAVFDFMADMIDKSKGQLELEAGLLKEHAADELEIPEIEPHDRAFVMTSFKEQVFDFSQEEVRPYFPVSKVKTGLFDIVNRLFGVEIYPVPDIDGLVVDLVHPDASYYQVFRDGKVIASFYFDLYARSGKQGGAWMDNAYDAVMTQSGDVHTPVAYLTCNFTPPTDEHEALLTHDEVTTLFHEFGHGLHHMLTRVNTGGQTGINGVPWDAVELPSQFMENFCWDVECVTAMSGHYETHEPLPVELLQKMLAAKNFCSAMGLARQTEMALFDLRIHHEYNDDLNVYDVLNSVRDAVSPFPAAEYNRFPCQFGHIFGGGYAAGYYSYKWAEVLSADAFSMFEGGSDVINPEQAKRFEDLILSVGGSKDIIEQMTEFLGREPNVDALLRHTGIIVPE